MTPMRALFPVLTCLVPTTAQAGLKFCNETDAKISVAIGYNDGGTWTSEGWWGVDPGACTSVVDGDLTRRYTYWRATSGSHSWEHANFMFCTSPEVFTIVGDENCDTRGYERHGFNEIDHDGLTAFTMTLNAGGASVPDRDLPMTGDAGDDDWPAIDEPAAGDPGFGPAPGTFGEPYSVAGILSHCDFYDAGLGCTVLANGWSYVATSYDNTDQDLLVALEELGVNVPLSISGDMISYEGSEAMITIRDWQVEGRDPYGAARAALQGFWTSTDDPSYQVLIHGSGFEEFSKQIPGSLALMHFSDGCPGAPGDGPAFTLASRDPSEDRCIFVSGVDGANLELFVAGTMRPLTFRRAN